MSRRTCNALVKAPLLSPCALTGATASAAVRPPKLVEVGVYNEPPVSSPPISACAL